MNAAQYHDGTLAKYPVTPAKLPKTVNQKEFTSLSRYDANGKAYQTKYYEEGHQIADLDYTNHNFKSDHPQEHVHLYYWDSANAAFPSKNRQFPLEVYYR